MRRRRSTSDGNSHRRRSKKSEAVSESEQHYRWLVPSSPLIHRHGIEFLRRARDALWQKHEDEASIPRTFKYILCIMRDHNRCGNWQTKTKTKKIVEQGKIVGSIPGSNSMARNALIVLCYLYDWKVGAQEWKLDSSSSRGRRWWPPECTPTGCPRWTTSPRYSIQTPQCCA